MNSTQKGDITEYKFILYCLQKEIPINKPISNNLPYDFIIDFNNQLLKVQVKTARLISTTNDTITFNTRSCSKNYNEVVSTDYKGKIDYFATYWDGKWMFVPIDKSSMGEHRIYMGESPKPNQHSYKEYLLF